MKKFHPLFGFILCLSFVSFAPMSLLVDDGRAPASEDPKPQVELKDKELTETKSRLEEAQAEVLAKEEELRKIKCENEGAIASLREDIKKIEKERNDISVMMDTLRLDYEQQMTHQQMQQQQMMMAMSMFSYQSMLTPQGNPYLQQSSVFDPSYQMMHIQQAQLVKQMNNMQYKPQVVNNYYGNYTGMYGNGGDFMEANPYELNHYNMFANNTVDLNNSTSMPASIQPSLMPGYFSF